MRKYIDKKTQTAKTKKKYDYSNNFIGISVFLL